MAAGLGSNPRWGAMKKHMIGICGPKGSGKSTAAEILCKRAEFARHRFAGPIKSALKVAFGLTDRHVDGDLKEVPTPLLNGRTPRHAMKTMGTQWGRDMIDKDIWVTAWRNTMPHVKNIIVDDVRFPNEIEMLRRDYGATIIRIVRPGHEVDLSHESESHVFGADFELYNNGDLELLENKVRTILMTDLERRMKPGFEIPARKER